MERQAFAARKAEQLFGCYRKGDAENPEVYAAAITAVLANYSEEVISHVTHPLKGIPGRQKFLPSVSEVKEACDDYAAYLFKQEENRRFQQRRQVFRLSGPAREPGSDYFSMFAKHGRPIGRFE